MYLNKSIFLGPLNKEINYNTTDNNFVLDGNVKINGTLESLSGCGGVKFLDDTIYIPNLIVTDTLTATRVKHKDMSSIDLSD